MRFTTQAEYGLICTLHLARFGAEGPVAAREMAEKEDLPADYTERCLRRLRQARIVRSVRGVSAGFELARPATEISVKDVIEATEGSTFEINCRQHPVGAERCDTHHDCSIRPVWYALRTKIDALLDQIRSSDLVEGGEVGITGLSDITGDAPATPEAR